MDRPSRGGVRSFTGTRRDGAVAPRAGIAPISIERLKAALYEAFLAVTAEAGVDVLGYEFWTRPRNALMEPRRLGPLLVVGRATYRYGLRQIISATARRASSSSRSEYSPR